MGDGLGESGSHGRFGEGRIEREKRERRRFEFHERAMEMVLLWLPIAAAI